MNNKLFSFLLNILLPNKCVSCFKYTEFEKGPLCGNCFNNINTNTSVICPICQKRLVETDLWFEKCTAHQYKTPISFCACSVSFNDPKIKKLIHLFKYKNLRLAAVPLLQLLKKYLQALNFQKIISGNDWIVVPIPLTKHKKLKRGYNQAEIISQFLSKEFNIPFAIGNLIKIKETIPQAQTKTKIERLDNIRDSFKITEPDAIRNKKIILVDDVITTGATINEAARVLRNAGAKQIIGLAIALG